MATIHLNRFFIGAFLLILFTAQLALLVHSKNLHPAKWPSFKNLEGSRKGLTAKGIQNVKNYMRKFGYLNDNNDKRNDHRNDDQFDKSLEIAVKKFQRFYKLNVTGILDDGTISQMKTPRCGVADVHDLQTLGIVSHYAFFPGKPRWPLVSYEANILYYSLDVNNASGVSLEMMRYIATEAFSQWKQASNITFEESAQGKLPDLSLGFVQNDGPGNVMAFSYPPTNGTLRFDAAENWSTDIPPAKTDIDIIWAAMHEIGHLLGLDHSTDKNAIMYSYIDPGVNKRTLSQDDIDGIRALYSS